MNDTPDTPAVFRVSDLPQNKETPFDLHPEKTGMKTIADDLGLLDLRKLGFRGTIRALGKSDWQLDGHLGVTVVQPCVVTLEPVTTRIDTKVTRRFLATFEEPEEVEGEVEMPEDADAEQLGPVIDVGFVMREAIALNLPLYPRAEGANLGEAVYTKPGQKPMTDEDTRPFAGLAGLRNKLSDKDKE